jgi:DNA-binding NtrC family response regulator
VKPRILIVDDEPAIVDALTLTFEDDYEVVAVTAPEEALSRLAEEEVAVIIADQRMPRLSGSEVLKAARELQPDAVRIVLSAYTDIEDLIAAINSGEVWRYLVKPWEPRELKVTVTQAVERHLQIKENQRMRGELSPAHDKLKRQY